MFANGPGDLGSILCRIIPKTLKMVLDTSLLNTQQYQLRIKGKVEQSRERSSALSYTSVWKLLKREPSGRPRLRSPTLLINTNNLQLYGIKCSYHLYKNLRHFLNGKKKFLKIIKNTKTKTNKQKSVKI